MTLTLGVRGWRICHFWMKFISLFLFYLMFSLFRVNGPISMAAALILIRFCFISIIGISSRWFFSYILFLVYVGGLLVIFIYICLIRRNFSFERNFVLFLPTIFLSYSMRAKPFRESFLGISNSERGLLLVSVGYLWLFVGLAILLLVLLLLVVRRTGRGALFIK